MPTAASIIGGELYPAKVLRDGAVGYWRLGDSEGYAQAVLSDAPVAYWRLDEASGNFIDKIAATVGTPAGTITRSQVGALADGTTAALFDGITGQVSATIANPGVGDFTLEAWVKPNGSQPNGGTNAFLDKSQGLGGGNFTGYWAALNGLIPFVFFNDTTAGSYIYQNLGGTPVVDAVWSHLVFVFVRTGSITAYINGAPVGSVSISTRTATVAPTSSLFIAKEPLNGMFFKGAIDEAAIYHYALSAQQITNHYALRTSSIATVAVATALDSAPTPHLGTIVRGVTLEQASPLADGTTAALFDGAGWIDVTQPDWSALAQVSIEAWLKPTSLTVISASGFQLALNFGSPAVYIAKRTSGGLTTSLLVNAVQRTQLSAGALVAGQWTHVVMTYDGATYRTYINALNTVSTGSLTGVVNLGAASSVLQIGRDHTGTTLIGEWWIGQLDEVAVYPTALTARQIEEHYGLRLAVLSGLRVSGAAAVRQGAHVIGAGGVRVGGVAPIRQKRRVIGSGGVRVGGAGLVRGISVGRQADAIVQVAADDVVIQVAADDVVVQVRA